MTMERKNERLADWSFHMYRTVVYSFWLVVLTRKGSNCWFKATSVFRDCFL